MWKRLIVTGLGGSLLLSGVGCGGGGNPSCSRVNNGDLATATGHQSVLAAVAGPGKLMEFDSIYVAAPDGALWATDYASNGFGKANLVIPPNDQARSDAPDADVNVPSNASFLRGWSATDSRAEKAISCAASLGSSSS